jgi:hypothetical protein
LVRCRFPVTSLNQPFNAFFFPRKITCPEMITGYLPEVAEEASADDFVPYSSVVYFWDVPHRDDRYNR